MATPVPTGADFGPLIKSLTEQQGQAQKGAAELMAALTTMAQTPTQFPLQQPQQSRAGDVFIQSLLANTASAIGNNPMYAQANQQRMSAEDERIARSRELANSLTIQDITARRQEAFELRHTALTDQLARARQLGDKELETKVTAEMLKNTEKQQKEKMNFDERESQLQRDSNEKIATIYADAQRDVASMRNEFKTGNKVLDSLFQRQSIVSQRLSQMMEAAGVGTKNGPKDQNEFFKRFPAVRQQITTLSLMPDLDDKGKPTQTAEQYAQFVVGMGFPIEASDPFAKAYFGDTIRFKDAPKSQQVKAPESGIGDLLMKLFTNPEVQAVIPGSAEQRRREQKGKGGGGKF